MKRTIIILGIILLNIAVFSCTPETDVEDLQTNQSCCGDDNNIPPPPPPPPPGGGN